MAYEDNPWGESTAPKSPSRFAGAVAKPSSNRVGRTKEVAAVGFQKTKVVASAGFQKSKVAARKIKGGATVGFNWIKLKYKKSKLFQKK